MAGSKRLRKGTEDTWDFTIECGFNADGKRIRQYVTFKGTESKAQKELNRLIVEYENGGFIEPTKMNFGEYLEYWLEKYAENKVEKTTLRCYEKIVEKHIIPKLGKIKLEKLRLYHIQEYVDSLIKNGRLDKKTGGLAPASIIKHYRIIHRALNYATTKEMLPRNVSDGVELPAKKKTRRKVLTIDQINTMIGPETWEGERKDFCRMADLAVHTALRREELLGLRERDIDFEKQTISVSQTVVYTPEEGVYIKPRAKNEESEGIVTIGQHEIDLIKQQIHYRKEKKVKAGPLWNRLIIIEGVEEENDLLFTQDNGNPIFPDTISSWFPEFMARHKLPAIRFHDLRHSHATLLLEAGESLPAVSERLRHAEKSTTVNIYAHVPNSTQRRLADTMTKLRTGQ